MRSFVLLFSGFPQITYFLIWWLIGFWFIIRRNKQTNEGKCHIYHLLKSAMPKFYVSAAISSATTLGQQAAQELSERNFL
jgi:hypothetical protein